MVSTAAFHARARGSVPGLGGLKETRIFLPHPRVKVSIVGSLIDREVACSASDHQGSNFEFCVWRTVSSQSSHHPQKVVLAQFSLYMHKGGLKPDSFHFIFAQSWQYRDRRKLKVETMFYSFRMNLHTSDIWIVWSTVDVQLMANVRTGLDSNPVPLSKNLVRRCQSSLLDIPNLAKHCLVEQLAWLYWPSIMSKLKGHLHTH